MVMINKLLLRNCLIALAVVATPTVTEGARNQSTKVGAANAVRRVGTTLPPPLPLTQQAKMLERSCAFVLHTNNAPIGTGFLISQAIPEPGMYFVTARHVLEAQGLFADPHAVLRLRVNSVDGAKGEMTSMLLALEGPRPWLQHDNDAVDIAVVPICGFRREHGTTGLGLMTIPYSNRPKAVVNAPSIKFILPSVSSMNFANEHCRKAFNVDVGSPILTMGLFPYINDRNVLQGDTPNLVVQKRGYIGALPRVPLVIDHLPGHRPGLAKVIYGECQVVHGNSGSPVFVQVDPGENYLYHSFQLLGVVSALTPDRCDGNRGTDVTSIVPVDYLCEILEHPRTEKLQRDLWALRKRGEEYAKERERILKKCEEYKKSISSTNEAERIAALNMATNLVRECEAYMEREKDVNGEYFRRYRTSDWNEQRDPMKGVKPFFNYW